MLKEIEDKFIFKKYNIFYYILKNENKSKDGILFLHGKGSHTKYFKNIIEKNKNINFYSFDLPGFGKSSGNRGHIKSFKIYIDLINFFVKEYIEKDNIQKLFIIGESMSSLLAYYFCNNFKFDFIKGLIFLPVILRLKETEKIHIRFILSLLNIFCPTLSFKGKRSIDTYTSNIEQKKIALIDPLWERNKTVRMILELSNYIKYLNNNLKHNKIPILFLHPKYDYYTDIDIVKSSFSKIPFNAHNKLIVLNNSKHWALIDNDLEIIKKSIYGWIETFKK